MLSKEQMQDKCIELYDKCWKLYYHTSDISNNKWRKAHQYRKFIEKMYYNA